jgi:hypothetical protein
MYKLKYTILFLSTISLSCSEVSKEKIVENANNSLTIYNIDTKDKFYPSHIHSDKDRSSLFWEKPDGTILKMAAPVVMGLLGKQQNEQNALNPDENGISNILMNLVGAASENNNQSFFESILDADNDGSIIDDVAEVISGKKKSGIAGIFGKLFNKN